MMLPRRDLSTGAVADPRRLTRAACRPFVVSAIGAPAFWAATVCALLMAGRPMVWAGEPVRATGGDLAKPLLDLRFDDDLVDASTGKSEGAAHGNITFVDGRNGRCACFDGQSWLDTRLAQGQLGEEYTVECWVKPDARQNPYADIFGNHVSQGLGFVMQQDAARTNHFLAAYGTGAGTWVTTDPVTLAEGRWQHVALVKTHDGVQFFLNAVLVAEERNQAPAQVSPTPVAVGLGYQATERCFRGLIDDFRIWDRALASFDHAGIDPADTRETRARLLTATPRPATGPPAQSWTLNTDDTRLTLGVTTNSELVVQELSSPAAGWNWIARPVAFPLPQSVRVAGQSRTVQWRFVETVTSDDDARTLELRFASGDPALEIVSRWQAYPGPGPIRHRMAITNRSGEPVTVEEQPTFDIDLSGADVMWCFHSDGGTPDPVGVYRHQISDAPPGSRRTVRTAPTGEFIPYVVLSAGGQHGVYLGLEWSFCRIESVTLPNNGSPALRVRGGNVGDLFSELAPGETLALRPGFLGTYRGDLDDAGNRLRRWLMQTCVPAVLRHDPGYPKVQWNAFGATGKNPGSWDPVEQKFYPLIDDIAPLGFEEVMIDVGWWQDDEPDSDTVDWPSGMRKAADYAHAKGMRFGLYWTDNLDMAREDSRRRRADRIRRLFQEYDADMWRSDCTRGEVVGLSFAATRGFYEMVDALAKEIPGFEWENCCGGGRIKDYGAMRRAVKIFNSDTYSALHVRQAFYDSSFAFHPAQLEGHLGSVDGAYRPHGVAGMRYAFRSTSMGAPEWFLDAPNGANGSDPWSAQERQTVRDCVETYKSRIRPLIRQADLYHILPRPDGRNWDGIEYYDPASGKGVVFLFKPAEAVAAQAIRLRGLDAGRSYRVTFQDGSQQPSVRRGADLLNLGVELALPAGDASELMFFEFAD